MTLDPWECTELSEAPQDWILATENGWGAKPLMHQSVTFPQRSLQCRPGVRRARTHPGLGSSFRGCLQGVPGCPSGDDPSHLCSEPGSSRITRRIYPDEVRSYRAVHDSLRSTPHDRLDEQLPARLLTQGSTSKASTRLGGGAAVQLIEATFVPGSAEEFGLVICGNGSEGTRTGIRPVDGRLAVDRTDRVAVESC